MNSKAYTLLGWLVWQVGSRAAKYVMYRKRTKVGAAGVVALVLVGGLLAARSGDDS